MATKKIIIDREDGAGEVVDRILGEPDHALILVVPRGSTLGKSARNFTLIKRESADAGKEISVESVDENILAFAKNAGMSVNHPLLRGRSALGASGISDIVPITNGNERSREDDDGKPVRDAEELPRSRRTASLRKPAAKKNVRAAINEEDEDNTETDDGDEDITGEGIYQEEKSFIKEEDRFFKKRQIPAVEEAEADDESGEDFHHPGKMGNWVGWTAAGIIVILAALYGVTIVFGSAKIAITFQKTPWSYNGNFTADKSVSAINAGQGVIPAQIFSVPKNVTQLFPASGQENVSLKAQGTITIYNAYSSSPQSLVATTRFVTPDGKIFRLVSAVVVPGAAVTNGQIVPSSINAPIAADQPGPDYNVSSTPKLTIPGFQGTPKYNAFYGAIASGTSGGFVGEKAVPTADDITSAKQKVTDTLTSDLQNGLAGSYTSNFKILGGATNIQITKLTVNTSTDANGNFSVFGEGALSAIGFDETAFKAFLLSLAQSTEASSTFSSLTLNYASATPDFTNGKLAFSLNAQGSLEPLFSSDDFRASVAGKGISDAKNAISSLSDLQEGTISVWPAWLWQIPANLNRIQMTVN
jgi:hypothetical protein